MIKKQKTSADISSVTAYEDYRDFLKDRFGEFKIRRSTFSYEYCSTRMKTSKSYLKQIFDKRMHIGLDKLARLSRLFKLSAFESRYLFFSVIRAQVNEAELANYLDGVLSDLRNKVEFKRYHEHLSEEDTGLPDSRFSGWLHLLLTALVNYKNFKPSAAWISSQLIDQIDEPQIENAFQDLLKSGAIVKGPQGYQESNAYHSPVGIDPESFKNYRIGLEKTFQILGDVDTYRPCRFFMGALQLDDASAKIAIERFQSFSAELAELSAKVKQPDQVLFFSNNMFGLTQATSKKK